MNKMRGLWLGFLILCLVGSIGCAGTKSHIKSEPSKKPPQGGTSQPQLETATPSPKPEGTAPGPLAEANPEKPAPSQMPKVPPSATTPAPAPASPPPPPLPVRPAEPQRGPGVVFNFDNADLYEVIRVMTEIMKMSYVVDPRVKGVVNIHTVGQISSEDVFPIFQSILRTSGMNWPRPRGSIPA